MHGLRIAALILSLLAIDAHAAPERFPIDDPRFVADYYPAHIASKRPGVLVLGGADGGMPTELAETFAAAGHPVLAVAYFGTDRTPAELEKIPLEYFDAPIKWLQGQPGVRPGIVVAGWSKGAELALLLATRSDAIERVVAISPSSVVWPGILKDWTRVPDSSWTAGGAPVPFVPFDHSRGAETLIALYGDSLRNADAVARARIPLERTDASLLLLSGDRDDVWPAATMSDAACAQAKRCTHLRYPELGHLLDKVFITQSDHPSREAILAFMAEPAADAP